jgi:hypothetical protein
MAAATGQILMEVVPLVGENQHLTSLLKLQTSSQSKVRQGKVLRLARVMRLGWARP